MKTPPKNPSLKVLLSLYLKEKYPNFINGGDLETYSITQGYKASNGSRRCRELADEGTFERRMNGKSVEYRYLQKEPQKSISIFRCHFCPKDAVTLKGTFKVCEAHAQEKAAPSLF
ncbi:MAG TPA: hypothetical protein VJ464_13465 [Blastocatellia bacterium]|nr:hypothetical protein [Blastocatellia bacterium]